MGVKVHTFTLQNELHDDTRIPFQYRGNAQSPAPRAFEVSYLLSYIASNLDISTLLQTLPEYDSDADASAGGLTSGMPYRTSAIHDINGNSIRFLP